MDDKKTLLDVRNLSKTFVSKHGVQQAINNVSFRIAEGEIMGLIGQSGSGKSTVANALMRTLSEVNGVVALDNEVVSGKLSRGDIKNFYRKVQMIFQDPHTALNEKRNVFSTIAEPLYVNKIADEMVDNFLRKDNRVLEAFEFTLRQKYREFMLSVEKMAEKRRHEAISNSKSALEAIEVPNFEDDYDRESFVSNLINAHYDEFIETENSVISYMIEGVSELLSHYQTRQDDVFNHRLPDVELQLLKAKEELEDYHMQTDLAKAEVKKAKLIAKITKAFTKRSQNNQNLFKALVLDRRNKAKFSREYALLSVTPQRYAKYTAQRDRYRLEADLLAKHLGHRKFAIPREDIYELDRLISTLPEDDIEPALIKANKAFEATNEIEKKKLQDEINLKDEEFTKEHKLIAYNEANNTRLTQAVEQAQQVFNKAKEEARVDFEAYVVEMEKRIEKYLSPEYKKMRKTMLEEAHANFDAKIEPLFTFFKDKPEYKDEMKRVKKAISNKAIRLQAHAIENKQIFKTLIRIQHIYGIKKVFKPLKRLIVRRLLVRREVTESLVQVGLKPEHAYRYPHEFSGGQKQRINIARALIMKPKLIIADEPIASLDVSIQAQVINILTELVRKKGISMIFIGHDLSVIEYLADTINVMHLGRVVEKGKVEPVFTNPTHPYTQTLFDAIPKVSNANEPFKSAEVDPRYLLAYKREQPKMVEISPRHFVLANTKQLEEWK